MNRKPQSLGAKIRDARKAAGLTQIEAAKKARVEQGYWSELETGKKEPTVATLRKIAKALGIKPSDLLSG